MLTIEIAKSKNLPGLMSCFLSFSEFNQAWVEVIRGFETRRYDPETKKWEFPIFKLQQVLQRYENLPVTIYYKALETAELVKMPEITLNINPETGKPYEFFHHQIEAIEYGLTNKKFILADDMGSGKTLTIIGQVLALKKLGLLKQALIVVCVSDLQWNWAKQIERYTNESYHILGEHWGLDKHRRPKRVMGSVADRVKDLRDHKETFLITNQVTLRNEKFVDMLRGEYKTFQNRIQLLCIDEFHKNTSNPTSIAGKNLQKLKDIPYIIPMTGTPLRNHPVEAWAPLKLIGKENSTYSAFKNMYCVYNSFGGVSGYKNLDYLQAQFSTCMVRRTKEELMPWLPERIWDTVVVDMNDRQKMIYDEAYNWALTNIDKIGESPNPLAQLIRLRQATGFTGILSTTIQESAKLDRMEDDVETILGNKQKVLIYSNWTDITDEIVRRLSAKYRVLEITGHLVGENYQGRKTALHVEEVKSRFNDVSNSENSIIVCTSKAGAGHDLVGGSWCLFVDEPWTYADKSQIWDRLHRPGQKNAVNIRTYVTRDTIDERVNMLVEDKGQMAAFVIDGEVRRDKAKKLTRFLLGIEE